MVATPANGVRPWLVAASQPSGAVVAWCDVTKPQCERVSAPSASTADLKFSATCSPPLLVQYCSSLNSACIPSPSMARRMRPSCCSMAVLGPDTTTVSPVPCRTPSVIAVLMFSFCLSKIKTARPNPRRTGNEPLHQIYCGQAPACSGVRMRSSRK